MHRTVLIVGIFVSTVFVVATGALPFAASDPIHDDVIAQPADGPNGEYAFLNGDDEIELLLSESNPNVEGDGIGEDTLTPLDRVFTITYTGDRYAEVWLTDDSDDVRFYHGEDPERSIERADDSVHLGPDQTVTVGLLIDTRGHDDVESADTFTIHAQVAEPDPDDEDDEDDETQTPTPTPTATDTSTSTTSTRTTTAAETPAQTDARPAAAPSGAVPPNASDGRASNGGDVAASGGQPPETASFDIPLFLAVFAALLIILSLGALRRSDLT